MARNMLSSNVGATVQEHLSQAIDKFNNGELECAKQLFLSTVVHLEQEEADELPVVYHKLGMVSHQLDELKSAEKWYWKAIRVDEKTGNKQGVASAYHNLSCIANDNGDFGLAEKWLQLSLQIKEECDDNIGVARSYHQLGVIAYRRNNYPESEKWYEKSLRIKEELGDRYGIAETYFNLAGIARKKNDEATADIWLKRALQIYEEEGNAHGVIEFGRIAEASCEHELAVRMYQKAADIAAVHDHSDDEASSCEFLGMLIGRQGDRDAAERWYDQALTAYKKSGDIASASRCCVSIGNLCLSQFQGRRPNIDSAWKWYKRGLELDDNATWQNLFFLRVRLWRHRLLSLFLIFF